MMNFTQMDTIKNYCEITWKSTVVVEEWLLISDYSFVSPSTRAPRSLTTSTLTWDLTPDEVPKKEPAADSGLPFKFGGISVRAHPLQLRQIQNLSRFKSGKVLLLNSI
jgi:hypothetical protein